MTLWMSVRTLFKMSASAFVVGVLLGLFIGAAL
ncbi:hypothetical protein SAMN05216188_10958 [Lentzea xinjiangensis]|uniref:Uncharacterized protein n=1 Tax=Lentzea xinjiangensis TaxID=402600 RepID=A0A1H9MHM5_9PSEU|nr:hypothetical protein SAMN05216188_10958 [Lentzea xinjiangensis]